MRCCSSTSHGLHGWATTLKQHVSQKRSQTWSSHWQQKMQSLSQASFTWIDCYSSEEAFLRFQHNIHQLCQTIRFGSMTAIEDIWGGSLNWWLVLHTHPWWATRACIHPEHPSSSALLSSHQNGFAHWDRDHLTSQLPPIVPVATRLADGMMMWTFASVARLYSPTDTSVLSVCERVWSSDYGMAFDWLDSFGRDIDVVNQNKSQ